ncbi:Hypothetical protein A7982_10903 [Minicystis rosea]|nr:Hypothetical protein A7982_10903 [Minicystis rosea]
MVTPGPPSTRSKAAPKVFEWIMVAIAIFLLIASVPLAAAIWLKRDWQKRDQKDAHIGCGIVRQAAEEHLKARPGSPCPTVEALVGAGMLSKQSAVDPWKTPFIVRCEGAEVEVRSAGPDRMAGTGDDLDVHGLVRP